MDKITLTLTTDTVHFITCMVEEYINDLYDERKIYKNTSRWESLNKYIKECRARLNELKSSIPQEAKEE